MVKKSNKPRMTGIVRTALVGIDACFLLSSAGAAGMAPSRELWDHNEPQDYLEELDEQKQVLKMTESEIRSFCGKTAFLFVFPNPIPVIQTEDSSPEGSEKLDSLIPSPLSRRPFKALLLDYDPEGGPMHIKLTMRYLLINDGQVEFGMKTNQDEDFSGTCLSVPENCTELWLQEISHMLQRPHVTGELGRAEIFAAHLNEAGCFGDRTSGSVCYIGMDGFLVAAFVSPFRRNPYSEEPRPVNLGESMTAWFHYLSTHHQNADQELMKSFSAAVLHPFFQTRLHASRNEEQKTQRPAKSEKQQPCREQENLHSH